MARSNRNSKSRDNYYRDEIDDIIGNTQEGRGDSEISDSAVGHDLIDGGEGPSVDPSTKPALSESNDQSFEGFTNGQPIKSDDKRKRRLVRAICLSFHFYRNRLECVYT